MLQSGLSFCLFVLRECPPFLLFDLSPVSMLGLSLKLFPFLVHCSLRIRSFHRLRHRNKFVHQIVMTYQIESFARNVLLVFLIHEIPLFSHKSFRE